MVDMPSLIVHLSSRHRTRLVWMWRQPETPPFRFPIANPPVKQGNSCVDFISGCSITCICTPCLERSTARAMRGGTG